jgi:DNA-binding Xre family transcriptional regulator
MEIYFVFFFPPQKKEKGKPTHIAHIGKAPQLVPIYREANAETKALPKSAILPVHTKLLDNYILYFEINLYFSENNLTEMNRIKEVLDEKGIKQTWLAEKLGKSYNMVNSYAQNRQQPRLEVLYEIAKILDVSPKDLLKEDLND